MSKVIIMYFLKCKIDFEKQIVLSLKLYEKNGKRK